MYQACVIGSPFFVVQYCDKVQYLAQVRYEVTVKASGTDTPPSPNGEGAERLSRFGGSVGRPCQPDVCMDGILGREQ